MDVEYHAWIFISHASDDLLRVREVRNYLESKGASPLLFHLKALAEPEQFWPIIEREIAARNFFLYCQSAVADQREWVRRERAAVEGAGRKRPIRVDSIRVDGGDLDFTKLDAFLAKTRVFPSYTGEDREGVRSCSRWSKLVFRYFATRMFLLERHGWTSLSKSWKLRPAMAGLSFSFRRYKAPLPPLRVVTGSSAQSSFRF